VICTGLALVFRNALLALLTKRVARGLDREADDYKQKLAREMTAYKDDLDRAQSVERDAATGRKSRTNNRSI